jgi:DNA repair protein RadC
MKTIRKFEIRSRRVTLGDLAAEPAAPYGQRIAGPDDVAHLARALIGDEGQEVFVVFLLDVRNRVMGYVEAGRGSVDACPVDPRQVFRAAVMEGASAIVVSHNHPSGSLEPSAEDDTLTRRLHAAGELLGLPVLDHLIVTDEGHHSYAAAGQMP